MITKITPEIVVEEVNKTLVFYEEILGFKRVMTVPEEGIYDWALIEKNNHEIMFQTKSSLAKDIPSINKSPIGNSMMLYIEVKNVDEFYKEIRKKVEVLKELHDTFYGSREFIIKDCNGYILIFSERIST